MATRKQKRVAKILMENGGMPIGKAMVMAGYSKLSALTPQKLTDSKGWLEVFDEAISDKDLIAVHKRGLKAFRETPRISGRDKSGAPIYEYIKVPDFHAQHKFLETGYKAKGRFTGVNSDDAGNLTINLAGYEQDNRHSAQIQPKTISIAVSGSNGRRIQTGSDSLASPQREGQDSFTSGD